ncbi:tetratricopeptide repeat protein, partial [Actinokineospora diospyrosa]
DVIAEITADPGAVNGLSDGSSEIRTIFEWSYTSLAPPLARTFRRLGLHPGTEFSVLAVAALTGLGSTQATRHLVALSDLHLVEPSGRERYQAHDLLHAYAAQCAERDETAEDRRAATMAVLTRYARTATAADRLLFPGNASLVIDLAKVDEPAVVRDRAEALTWLSTELTTLQAALRLTEQLEAHPLTMAIAGAMRFLATRPRATLRVRAEAETAGIAAAQACGATTFEITFRIRRGDTHQQMESWVKSDTDHRDAYALAERVGDTILRGEALCALGRTAVLQERHADAEPYYRQALPLLRDVRGGSVEAAVHANLSVITTKLGRHAEALDHAEHELAFRLALGSPPGVAHARHNIAVALQGLGDHQRALDLCREVEACYRVSAGWDQELAEVLMTMTRLHYHLHHRDEAVRCFSEAADILLAFDAPRPSLHDHLKAADDG